MLRKSKVETAWLEQEIISALFVQMSWGELFPPKKQAAAIHLETILCKITLQHSYVSVISE